MSASFIELIKGVVVRVVVFNATFNNISYFSYIVEVSVIVGGNRRKPPTFSKSPTNLINNIVSSTPRHERELIKIHSLPLRVPRV